MFVAKNLPKKSTSRSRRSKPRTSKGTHQRDIQRLERAVTTRERELAILADVATRLHGQEDVQAILDQTLDSLVEGLELSTAWVLLEDPKNGQLRLAAHRGVAAVFLDGVERDGLGTCLCPEVFSSGRGAMARNTTDCPRMPTIGEGLEQPVAHACVPLAFNGTSHGVLNVAALPDEVFTDEELRFLETVGRQVCMAVEGARHLKAERLYNQEARALAALNKGIGESLDPEAVLEAVGRTALDVLRVDRIHILLGSDARELTVAHLAGLPHPELVKGQTLDLTVLGGSLHRRALEEQRGFAVEDWAQDERVNKELARRWAGASAAILPLVARRTSLGLLVLTSASPQSWTADQVELAEAQGDFYTILSIQLNGLLAEFQIKKEDDEGPSPSHQQAIGTRHVGGNVRNILGVVGGHPGEVEIDSILGKNGNEGQDGQCQTSRHVHLRHLRSPGQ